MKALVISGPTIADVVFSTPIIRALKVQLDDLQLHVLAELSYAFTLDENPYVDNIHFYTPSIWKNYRRLQIEKFDLVINLNGSWKSKCLSYLLNAKTYSTKSIRLQQWLMVNLKIDHLPDTHLVNRMFEGLEPLKLKPDELGLDYFIPEKDRVARDWFPEPFSESYLVFCISASHNTRKLTVDRLIELCAKISKPVVLLGAREDVETGEVVRKFFDRPVRSGYGKESFHLNNSTVVYNACGKFNFDQMASVIKQSRAVFTFDNEFIPVASAFKKEIFVLWGNTILPFGRFPYRTKFTALENNKISCRPCSVTGFGKCPKGHFNCMNQTVFDFYLP